jgi:glycosyltransferase involved in cell wall biosynthesis
VARLNSYFGSLYIVLSQYLADIVRSNNHKSSIAVIPVYGVDTRVFKPALETRAMIRERLGLPQEGEIIFFSSRIAPEKDSETLLQAFKLLRADGRSLWLLHRSGGYKDFLRAAERFGVANWVIAGDAVDPRQELALNYQASDVCVQASRAEGLGFSALEALACNVPVIAAAVGGLKETIIDGQTGWTYPAGDATALAECIVEVLRDGDEAMRRGNNGRGFVVSVYERKQVFEVLQETLQSLLQNSLLIHTRFQRQ